MIYLIGQKLSYDPLIIFRLGSKPKSLHIRRTILGNTQNRPPTKSQNVKCSETDFVGKHVFFKSRPRMAPQADPQSGKCSYIDLLSFIFSSKTGFSRPTHSLLPQVLDLNRSFFLKKHFFIWSNFGFIFGRT